MTIPRSTRSLLAVQGLPGHNHAGQSLVQSREARQAPALRGAGDPGGGDGCGGGQSPAAGTRRRQHGCCGGRERRLTPPRGSGAPHLPQIAMSRGAFPPGGRSLPLGTMGPTHAAASSEITPVPGPHLPIGGAGGAPSSPRCTAPQQGWCGSPAPLRGLPGESRQRPSTRGAGSGSPRAADNSGGLLRREPGRALDTAGLMRRSAHQQGWGLPAAPSSALGRSAAAAASDLFSAAAPAATAAACGRGAAASTGGSPVARTPSSAGSSSCYYTPLASKTEDPVNGGSGGGSGSFTGGTAASPASL